MHLVNVTIARAVWLFPTEEMNPRGLDLRFLLAAVHERYSFQKGPTPEDLVNNAGLEFAAGGFNYEGEVVSVTASKVFSDGLIAETKHSTEASDALLEDALAFAVEGFGWSFDQKMINRRAYFDELTVDLNISIDSLGGKLKKISDLLSESSPETPFLPFGLKFGVDPVLPAGSRTPIFVLERRVNSPFEKRRYFSQSPTTTDRHLQILKEIEKIFG